MLTLADIDAKFPETHAGSVYSDLYKDVYGMRPRESVFGSVEAFDADFERLVKQLDKQLVEDAIRQTKLFEQFVARVTETQALLGNCTHEHAIEVIADADGELEDMKFYGYERLEWAYGLKYDSIKRWLKGIE